MRSNQPNVIIHEMDASILLLRAHQRDNGEKLKPIFDSHGNEVPDLPLRGEVDFIKGGK